MRKQMTWALAVISCACLAGCLATLPKSNSSEDAGNSAAVRKSELRQLQSLDLGLAEIPAADLYLAKLMSRIQDAGPQPVRYAKVVIRPRLSYNASTMANGLISIDIGWLKSIDSEAELVALLSHEYAHIALDHLRDRSLTGGGIDVFSKYYKKKFVGNNDWIIGLAGEGWSSLLNPSWSRTQETEADAFAFDITQKLGYSAVASMRSFLDRIQSVEKNAHKTTDSTATINSNSSLVDAHPKIEERIANIQKLMEGKPRQRPTAKSKDEWRTIRDASAFKAAEKEIVLASSILEAIKSGKSAEASTLLKQLEALPKPYKSAATLTMLAYFQKQPAKRIAYLEQAIAAPDTAFVAYGLLAGTQRDQLNQYVAANETLEKGLERFESPYQHWPDVIDFHRVTIEKIDQVARDQRDTSLTLYAFKLKAKIFQLQAKCQLELTVADACTWASLDAQQKQDAVEKQKKQESAMTDQMMKKLKLSK